MKFIPYAFILVQFLQLLVAGKNVEELEPCNATSANSNICYASDVYHSNTPSESPMSIITSLDIREIVDINESKQTLTLLINFKVTWIDKRIQRTNNTNSWNTNIDISDHIKNLWVPELYFSNSVKIEKFKGLKAESMRQLCHYYDKDWGSWWYKSFVFNLVEPFTTEFACKMNFHEFPFDRHTCMFEIRPASYFKITPMLKTGPFQENANTTLHLNSTGLPFDLKAYPMTTSKASEKTEDITFAPSRIQFDVSRNTDQLKTLVISFYIPSMAFTILSQFSYFIKPEVVGI